MENKVKFIFQARVFIRGMGVGNKYKISAQYFQNSACWAKKILGHWV